MRRGVLLAFLLVVGCARSHLLPDGSPSSPVDAAPDGGALDAGAPTDPGAAGDEVSCGPNRCFHGEVCCSAVCGVCGTEGACPTGPPCFGG